VLALVLAAVVAAADHPCLADAQRLCSNVEPGEGRVAACLKQHEGDLSPACKQQEASFRDQMGQLTEACKGDAQKFCTGMQPGGGRIARCLQQHADDLSPGCKTQGDKLFRRRAERRAVLGDVQQACKGDVQKFCSGVKPGEGRLAGCLKQHQNELSSGCTDTIEESKDRW
jgi:hypothetical protein